MATPPPTRFDDATASNSNVDVMMAVVLGAAAAWIVSEIGTPVVLVPTDPAFNPLVVMAMVLGAISAYNLVRGIHRRRVVSRFGTTVFDQDGSNVYVGETLRGRVVTSQRVAAAEGFTLRLRCIERKGESWDEKTRRTHDAVVWEASKTVFAADSRVGIPVEFVIPVSALANAKFGSPDWSLKVTASVDGRTFEALFALRVYDGSREEDERLDDEVPAAAPAP